MNTIKITPEADKRMQAIREKYMTKTMQKQIQELMEQNGFTLMDSYEHRITRIITEIYRKGEEDIKISYILSMNKDNL